MKNKKKPSSQIYTKNDSKYDRHEPAVVLKKSPVKQKPNQPKTQTSLQSSNLHQFNKTTLFYGKKYHYSEINPKRVGDSNQSSTHCSFNNRSHKQKSGQNRKNKSKSLKGIKNHQLRHEQIQEQDEVDIRLNSIQVMQLINSYATKIQRQWRRYWFRKCLRFIILKERQRKQYEMLNSYYNSDGRSVENCRISYDFQGRIPVGYKDHIDKKRHTLPKLPVNNVKRKSVDQAEIEQKNNESYLRRQQQQNSNDNQFTEQFYNNKKYASLSSIHSGKLISNADVSVKNKQSQHDRTSSLGQNVQISTKNSTKSIPKPPQMVQIGLNCSLNQLPQNNTYLSTPVNGLRAIQDTTQKKSSDKKSNIKLQTKVYECKVEEIKPISHGKQSPKPSQHYSSKNLMQQFKRAQKQQLPNILSTQSLNSKYDTKFPSSQNLQKGPQEVTKIFKKYKKAIQKQGNKKLSKIMKHFEEKQITERTYKNLIQETKDKLNKEIKTLQLKQGHFHNSWKQVYVMYKDYVRENSYHQGETPRQKEDSHKMKQVESHHDELSISFDKWDFQSSAKKSISQLESFEDFARELNERNPQKLKGFFIETKKLSSDNKPIELVLDQLDRLQNDVQKQPSQVSEFKDQGGSIYEEFKQRERTSSFQKKTEHVLVENIAEKITEKLSYADMKSPHVSPRLSPKQSKPPLKRNSKQIPSEQQLFGKKTNLNEAKRTHFEFPQITTPPKSIQRQGYLQQVEIVAPGKSKITEVIKTDESDEDSQVEMKITSIKVGDKEKNNNQEKLQEKKSKKKIENELFVPQNHKEKLENSLLRQLEAKKQLQRLQQIKKAKQKKQSALKAFQMITNKYFQKRLLTRRSYFIQQITCLLNQTFKQKQRRRQQQQLQLRKYPPTIDPTIDAINSWLLQISHHLLDHHNAQIKKNLTQIKQLPSEQMLQISHSLPLAQSFYQTHTYTTITQKIFKQFEFFYLKNVAHNLQISDKHEHNFQHLLYGFHRCLIDSMNLTLMDELIIGRNWVMIPWVRSFRYKKNETHQHSKQCLQRAINRVSGWAQYSLAQLQDNADPSQVNQLEWKQYQQEKINMVIKDEVMEMPVENQFVFSWVMMNIYQQVYQQEMILIAEEMKEIHLKRQEEL